MKHVEVSVIIPVHNGADYIAQAIDSALIQDVPLEITVRQHLTAMPIA